MLLLGTNDWGLVGASTAKSWFSTLGVALCDSVVAGMLAWAVSCRFLWSALEPTMSPYGFGEGASEDFHPGKMP